jgi:two-component system sensor kinase FixL
VVRTLCAAQLSPVCGAIQDADVHAKAPIAMIESPNAYRKLFDESPEAIVVHINGAIALANKAAIKLFAAATAQDLVGQPISEFTHPEFHQAVAAQLSSIAQSGESAPPFEIEFTTANGQPFTGEASSMLLLLDGEHCIRTYIRDITECKHHETRMAKLHTELSATLAWQVAENTVAALGHEVNQPLASASILCEVAKRMLVTDGLSDEAKAVKTKRLEQTLEQIASDIERAGIAQRGLLKTTHKKPDITMASAMVNAMVTESIQTTFLSGVFDYQIVTDYADDLPAVEVNQLQVVKVLLNLIQNATQAMHEATMFDGKIWISTALAADGSEVCVSVRDEGPGISADLREEVFQPFITTKSHGLGMGLSISRALIEANGGKLWHSQENGRGVTFHLTLPIPNKSNVVQEALT